LLAAATWLTAAEPAAPPSGNRTAIDARGVGRSSARRVLIDGIHANDLSTVEPAPAVYDYHATTGYGRAFAYLRSQGVICDRITEGPLDSAMLSKYGLLFINLCSAERSPFLVSEIAAIRRFLVEGGSMFVVTDHTNCYFHAHILKPLFTELDIQTHTSTACDVPPYTLGSGNAWISVTRFKSHPITAGLRRIVMQTGGCVDLRFAVALTSENSWADAWRPVPFGQENGLGFYGNFVRDPGEASGPLGVVLAKPFGRGRIVVVGDQNMLGGCFINYADNYRLWLNAMAWLLGDERLALPAAYEQWRSPRIVCYERFDHAIWGTADPAGCYKAWVLLTRSSWLFADDRLSGPCDLMLFAYNDYILPPEVAAAAAAHLRRGKNILVLNAEGDAPWQDPGAVGQILAAMHVSQPKLSVEKSRYIVSGPSAGKIHILRPDQLLDNWILPCPEKTPSKAELQQSQYLLNAVRDALK
jgi:hypothetical protein